MGEGSRLHVYKRNHLCCGNESVVKFDLWKFPQVLLWHIEKMKVLLTSKMEHCEILRRIDIAKKLDFERIV